MPKLSRPKVTCKPKSLHIGPLDKISNETLTLLHEELEAMYLADVKNLYHEESALRMKISRPTFSKLLKSARKKCAKAFLHAKSLHITLKSATMYIIFPSDDGQTLSERFNTAKYFMMVSCDELDSYIEEKIENPIYKAIKDLGKIPENDEMAKGLGSGRVIPPLLTKATIVCSVEMGDGMCRNLESLGIEVRILPKKTKKKELLAIVENFL
ncbi:MAG: DUF134 domain-containing protein [Campylobacteraceae bacterium]|nr:DUF134 domain-containing protein [Campylobacteraceae bacterium]